MLGRVMGMALNPFADEYPGGEGESEGVEEGRAEWERFTGDVPREGRAMMCSCSS